jgi:hypothetical protein
VTLVSEEAFSQWQLGKGQAASAHILPSLLTIAITMVMLMDLAQDGLREDHRVFEKDMRKNSF